MKLLTVEQAAERAGVSSQTVRNRIKSGDVTPHSYEPTRLTLTEARKIKPRSPGRKVKA